MIANFEKSGPWRDKQSKHDKQCQLPSGIHNRRDVGHGVQSIRLCMSDAGAFCAFS